MGEDHCLVLRLLTSQHQMQHLILACNVANWTLEEWIDNVWHVPISHGFNYFGLMVGLGVMQTTQDHWAKFAQNWFEKNSAEFQWMVFTRDKLCIYVTSWRGWYTKKILHLQTQGGGCEQLFKQHDWTRHMFHIFWLICGTLFWFSTFLSTVVFKKI